MTDPLKVGRPLTQLMEWFPDLHKAEFGPVDGPLVDGLAARCPVVHEEAMPGVVQFTERDDGLWSTHGCDVGCTWGVIVEACELGRRVAGEDDGDPPASAPEKERNRFVLAYTRFSVEELTTDPPPLEYILKPYIPAETVSVLSAPGGSKKTTLLTLMAVSRALNRRMFREVVPREGETVILTTEDRKVHYRHKLAALRGHLGTEFDAGAVAERVHLLDMAGILVRLIVAERGNQFRPSSEVEELADAIQRKAPNADHIMIETISRVTGGIESNEAMSVLVSACERLAVLTKLAVTLVGHVGQNVARSGVADAYSSRGGSSLGDNARSSMVLMPLSDANREKYANGLELSQDDVDCTVAWTHEKSNGPKARPLLMRSELTPLGPVLVDVDYSRAEPTGEREKKTPGRKANRTYEQTRKAICDYVAAKQPCIGNAIAQDLGGTRGHILTAIADLIKENFLGRDDGGRLVVRNAGSNSKPKSNQGAAEPSVRIPSPSLSLQREGEEGDSVPDGFGSTESVLPNRTKPKAKEPF